MANQNKLILKSGFQLSRRKLLLLILMLGAFCFAALHFTTSITPRSFIGRWRAVGGGEVMIFNGKGAVEVTTGGTSGSPGFYTLIDSKHLRVEFAFGSPRLLQFSPDTSEMTWTNEQEGIVLRYRKEFGSSLRVQAAEAFGL